MTSQPTPGERPASWKSVARLVRLRPGGVAALAVVILLDSGSRTLLPWLYGRLVDGVSGQVAIGVVLRYGTFALALIGLSFLTSTASRYMAISVGQQIAHQIRTRLFRTLQEMPLDDVDCVPSGQVLNHFNAETAQTQSLITGTLPQVLALAGTTASVAALAQGLSWAVAIIFVVALPLTTLWTRAFTRSMATLSGHQLDVLAAANNFVLERSTSLGALTARSSSDGNEERLRYATTSQKVGAAVSRFGLLNAVNSGGLTSLAGGMVAFTYVAGAYAASKGAISVGQIVTTATLVPVIVGPLTGVADLRTATLGSRIALSRLLSFEPRVLDPTEPHPVIQPSAPGAARIHAHLSGVGIRRGSVDVLTSVNITLFSGTVNVLTGAAGSGKTSLLRCIAGIDPPIYGAIKLRPVPYNDLGGKPTTGVQLVPQEPHFFSGSVLSNFRLAAPECTEQDIWEACRQAGIDTTVASWPHGLAQELGEHGSVMSGGQRAKLALARALVANPAALLLDEPLAHLDPVSRRHCVRLLAALSRERLVVVSSHHEAFESVPHRKFIVGCGSCTPGDTSDMALSS